MSDNIALFGSTLLKSELNSKNDNNGQLKNVKLISEKPKAIEPILPDPTNQQAPSPTFGSKISIQKKNLQQSLQKSNVKPQSENSKTLSIKKKKTYISNNLCFKLLVINLAFFALAIWPAIFTQPVTIGESMISINVIDEKENSSKKHSDPQDILYNLNLEFEKMNQELESFIAEIENPKKATSNFHTLLPFSIIFLGIQLLMWGTYLSFK